MSDFLVQYRKDVPSDLCVLIAEDDPHIRLILRQAFHSRHVPVFDAPDGLSAVSIYRKHCDAIPLVLLDVNLPDINGPEVLAELRLLNPDVKCCFITGGDFQFSKKDLMQLGAVQVFEKPFENILQLVEATIEICDNENRSCLHVHGGLNHRCADSEPPTAIYLEHGDSSDDEPDSNHHGNRR